MVHEVFATQTWKNSVKADHVAGFDKLKTIRANFGDNHPFIQSHNSRPGNDGISLQGLILTFNLGNKIDLHDRLPQIPRICLQN